MPTIANGDYWVGSRHRGSTGTNVGGRDFAERARTATIRARSGLALSPIGRRALTLLRIIRASEQYPFQSLASQIWPGDFHLGWRRSYWTDNASQTTSDTATTVAVTP